MRTAELARTYQSKSDDELIALAQSRDLTPEAELVLRNELALRGFRWEADPEETEDPDSMQRDGVKTSVAQTAHSVAEFASAVTRMYRDHFGLFLKLTVPAVAIGYIAVVLSRQESRELARHLFRDGSNSRNLILLQVGLINYAGHIIAGIATCLSFAAICAAVRDISFHSPLDPLECFRAVRKRLGPVLRVSVLLLVLVWLATIALSSLIVFALVASLGNALHLHFPTILIFSVTTASLGLLLVSRFGLAIPAVMLDDYKVGYAMFRSDELTEGKWLTLAMLLIKSVFGAYLVGMLPFWMATLIWRYIQLPGWFLTLCSYLGVTMVEPFMFIGFALLYVRMTAAEAQTNGEVRRAASAYSLQHFTNSRSLAD